MSTSTTHITTRRVRHNGKLYPKNAVIPLTGADAEHLTAHGAVVPAAEVAIAAENSSPEPRKMTRSELIEYADEEYGLILQPYFTREDFIAYGRKQFGLTLAAPNPAEPAISSSALASAEADLDNKATGLADPSTMTREALFAEGLLYDLVLPPNIGDPKLRERIIEARATKKAA